MSSPPNSINVNIINNLPNNIHLPKPAFQKMLFIMNALEEGWTIKKSQDSYIFTKKHENRKEIFQENYLDRFISEHSNGKAFLDSVLCAESG
jgi:hypothetical protein